MVRNIAIVEDNLAEADRLRQYFDQYTQERETLFNITHFESAEQFLAKYEPVYDIVLLDIMLPQMNGMEAAVKLRELDETITIIFVTNMAQFAVRGYEVNAFDFVVKPVSYSNFSLKLQRVLNKLSKRRETDVIVSTSEGIFRIASSRIKYIEISGHRLVYHTTSGNIGAYGTLKEVEATLSSKVFVRCNNSYLVNLNYVRAIRGYTVLVGSDELPISRPKKKPFVQAVNDFLGGGIG